MKASTIFILLVLSLVLLFGLFLWLSPPPAGGQPGDTGVRTESKLTLSEKQFDFGSISMANGVVRRRFTVKNTTNEPVTMEKVYTSCMCTSATLYRSNGQIFGPFGMPGHRAIPRIDQVLAPGEEVTVEAAFDPNAHGPAGVGQIVRDVYIENSPSQKSSFTFSAFVTP